MQPEHIIEQRKFGELGLAGVGVGMFVDAKPDYI